MLGCRKCLILEKRIQRFRGGKSLILFSLLICEIRNENKRGKMSACLRESLEFGFKLEEYLLLLWITPPFLEADQQTFYA